MISPAVPTHAYLANAVNALNIENENMGKLTEIVDSASPDIDKFCMLFIENKASILRLSAEQSQFDEYNYNYAKAEYIAGREIDLEPPAPCDEVLSLQVSATIYSCGFALSILLNEMNGRYPKNHLLGKILDSYRPEWYVNAALENHDFDPCLQYLLEKTHMLPSSVEQDLTPEMLKTAFPLMKPVTAADVIPQVAKIIPTAANKPPLLVNALISLLVKHRTIDVSLLHTFTVGDLRTTQIFNLFRGYNDYPLLCLAGLTYNAQSNCHEYRVHKDYSFKAHSESLEHHTSLGVSEISDELPIPNLFRLLLSFADYLYINNSKTLYSRQQPIDQARN